jgi:Tfp pilus assembly protein PilN
MRAVNLLPRDVATTKGSRLSPPVVTGLVAAFLVVAVLGAGFFKGSANVARKQTELDAARAELALIPAPAAQDSMSSTLATERVQRVTALQTALNGRISWDRVLREVSLVLPNDVWLSSLTLQAPVSVTPVVPVPGEDAPPPPPTSTTTSIDFQLNGKAFSHQGVARLLSRLALVPDLQGVTLGHSTRTELGKRGAVDFTVTAGIRTPGGTS